MDDEEEEHGVSRHIVPRSFDRNVLFAPFSSFLLHRLLSSHHFPSRCFPDLDENPMDSNFTDVVIRAGKSLKFEMCDPFKAPLSKKPRQERNCARPKLPDSPSEVMDQKIWKEFPEDLMEVVIARLPIDAFFRFRVVCRKWNSLLSSTSFCHHCAQVPQSQPWSFTITHGKITTGAMYDPIAKKWHHLMIPRLPPELYLLPVASAGGLICLNDIGHKKFFVCNPLTQTWKELPGRSVNVWSPIVVGMIWSKSSCTDGYKIIWVGSDGKHEVYDSINNSWARPGDIPPEISIPLSLKFKSQAVSINTTIYFLRSDPEGIVSYDVESGVWKQFLVPNPPHSTDYTLAECGGRIMLVGLLTKNAATCVCIWELQRMTLLWKEVDRMPNIWCLEFYGKHVSMNCLGNKGLLMLSVRSRLMNRVVAYDVVKKKWLKVPCCGKSQGRKRRWVAYGTAFYPCLTAAP
ncbi:F-box only protein 6-like protein [Drosera capensis]